MLWIEGSEYSAERCAYRMGELGRLAQCSTRRMLIVAGFAVMTMTVVDVGLIYAL